MASVELSGVSEGVVMNGHIDDVESPPTTSTTRTTTTPLTNGSTSQREDDYKTSPDIDNHKTPNDSRHQPQNQVPLLNQPAYTPLRKLRIITIGAGFSSLIFAHKLRYEHPDMETLVSNTIHESRASVGGTWLVNSYPGVQCDVPSHIYAFPFDPNPDWDRFYSTGPQIQAYIERTVQKWDLARDIVFESKVVGAFWEEDRGKWRVVIEGKHGERREEWADVLVSAQGFLNTWKWPEIDGIDEFQGKKVHSASWDHDYDYSRKKIAVIGNGSSGIQILPSLARLDGTEVTSFQRGPTWIVARMDPGRLLGKPNIGSNPEYTEEDKRKFREDKDHHRQYRRNLIHRINNAFRMYSGVVLSHKAKSTNSKFASKFVKDSVENQENTAYARKQMADKLNNDPVLCEKLIPKWELGCRRVTPGAGYLEAFLKPNVQLTQSPITKLTKDSIVTEDGNNYKVDVVVCATGFDVSHCPIYPIVGRNKVSLADKWADEPESYFSVACPDFPNYFIFTGPNAVVGHGSLVEGLGWVAEYIIKWLRKIISEDIQSVAPTQRATDDFTRYGDEIHKTLVWTGQCRSWYKKNRVDGRVTATFPGSALLFRKMISDIRGEDFEIRYNTGNKFRFMGNGFTEYELDDSNDLAWYVKN